MNITTTTTTTTTSTTTTTTTTTISDDVNETPTLEGLPIFVVFHSAKYIPNAEEFWVDPTNSFF